MKKATFGQFQSLDDSGNEALNTICSNLQFAGRDVRKIVFTSCESNDGKSFVAMQIARNLARRGKRVVVVDMDLRQSRLICRHKMETQGEWMGAAHYLAGYGSVDDIVYETNLQNMFIVPVGRTLANPIKILDSPLLGTLLDALADAFDIVLVDAPPIGAVIDAALIAQACDGAVFVVRYNGTGRQALRDAQKQMVRSGCPILGAVINQVTFSSLSDRNCYNKIYYSHYSGEHGRPERKHPSHKRGT